MMMMAMMLVMMMVNVAHDDDDGNAGDDVGHDDGDDDGTVLAFVWPQTNIVAPHGFLCTRGATRRSIECAHRAVTIYVALVMVIIV